VYVVSSDGRIHIENLWTGRGETVVTGLSGSGAIDLSPSGNTLATAELTYYTSAPRSFLLMERATHKTRAIPVSFGYYDAPRGIAFRGEDDLWVLSESAWGTPTLGTVSFADPVFSQQLGLNASALLAFGADRNRAFVSTSNGRLTSYDSLTGDTFSTDTGRYQRALAANSAGTEVYVGSDAGVKAYTVDGAFVESWTIPGNIAGLAYSPEQDMLVVAFVSGKLELYNTQGGDLIRVLDPSPGIYNSTGLYYGSGYVRASRGGGLVTLNTDSGLRVYALGATTD
jgi:WD40 repeat protein